MPKLTPAPEGNWTGEWVKDTRVSVETGEDEEYTRPQGVPCIECGKESNYSAPGSGSWYCVNCWAKRGLWEEATNDETE